MVFLCLEWEVTQLHTHFSACSLEWSSKLCSRVCAITSAHHNFFLCCLFSRRKQWIFWRTKQEHEHQHWLLKFLIFFFYAVLLSEKLGKMSQPWNVFFSSAIAWLQCWCQSNKSKGLLGEVAAFKASCKQKLKPTRPLNGGWALASSLLNRSWARTWPKNKIWATKEIPVSSSCSKWRLLAAGAVPRLQHRAGFHNKPTFGTASVRHRSSLVSLQQPMALIPFICCLKAESGSGNCWE